MQTVEPQAVPVLRKLLFATDLSPHSEAAFRCAVGICERLRAELLILHVIGYAEALPSQVGEPHFPSDPVLHATLDRLDDLVQIARSKAIVCESTIDIGLTSSAILDTIEAQQVDLVIMGTGAPHGVGRLIAGSTAETLLRKARCPVLIVGPRSADDIGEQMWTGPVVFATDFGTSTNSAVRYASAISVFTDGPLHCLHVLPPSVEGGPKCQIILQIILEALKRVVTSQISYGKAPVFMVTYADEVSQGIVSYARSQKASVIVLGVQQATTIAAHLSDNITSQVIAQAPCPVLTVNHASVAPHLLVTSRV